MTLTTWLAFRQQCNVEMKGSKTGQEDYFGLWQQTFPLQPSPLFRQMCCLHPIARSQFLHRCREMIAHRPFGQRKACGDVGKANPGKGGGEYLSLSIGQRIVALGEREQG